ncbi:phage tail assembly chaperone [Pseudomonas sp. NPDC089401]|uniref:phage tail assembly chaperone n=1 Tax=Pseudomonas sp. NPDC089401 TaxID=3364462 RepID=UPI00381D095B
MFYSPSENTCYSPDLRERYIKAGTWPADAVELSQELFASVVSQRPADKLMQPGADGLPELVDFPAADSGQILTKERTWRDAKLAEVVWLRDRHRDQLEIGSDTTLTAEQFNALLVFMQALRDWPQSDAFPDVSQRPAPPVWLAEQTR